MASAANVLNNTILVPYHDSLTNSSHDLKASTIPKDLETYATGLKDSIPALRNTEFSISLISNGKTTEVGKCVGIFGLSMSRGLEKKRTGGEALYETKLPGRISYNDVTLNHVYTNSSVFLDWLINGSAQGGAMFADVQITVGDDNGTVVYTLRDAFPVAWELGNISVVSVDEVTKIRQRNISEDAIPLEAITIAYGRLDYAKGK